MVLSECKTEKRKSQCEHGQPMEQTRGLFCKWELGVARCQSQHKCHFWQMNLMFEAYFICWKVCKVFYKVFFTYVIKNLDKSNLLIRTMPLSRQKNYFRQILGHVDGLLVHSREISFTTQKQISTWGCLGLERSNFLILHFELDHKKTCFCHIPINKDTDQPASTSPQFDQYYYSGI